MGGRKGGRGKRQAWTVWLKIRATGWSCDSSMIWLHIASTPVTCHCSNTANCTWRCYPRAHLGVWRDSTGHQLCQMVTWCSENGSRLWSGYRESLNYKREISVIFSEAIKNNRKNSLRKLELIINIKIEFIHSPCIYWDLLYARCSSECWAYDTEQIWALSSWCSCSQDGSQTTKR